MPSTITHTYIGLDTIDKLDNKPKDIINHRVDNYKIYCQSMDVLYFYHIFLLANNRVQELGHRLHHQKTFDVFDLLINDNRENKDLELFTFISGLLTHYVADSMMHPYINYLAKAKNKTKKFNKHFEIETYLDNYFIHTKMQVDPRKINNTKFVSKYTEEEVIKEEISKLYEVLFHYHNMGNKYYHSLKEMLFFFNHLRYDKYGVKRKIYKLIDLNPFNIPRIEYLSYYFNVDNDEYYLNLNHQEWYNIKDKSITSNKSFLDLYQDVIEESSHIINELYNYVFEEKETDLKRLIKNNSYSTGLPLSPNK